MKRVLYTFLITLLLQGIGFYIGDYIVYVTTGHSIIQGTKK